MKIKTDDLHNVDLDALEKGAHYVMDEHDVTVAILMRADYYNYLTGLMSDLRTKIENQEK